MIDPTLMLYFVQVARLAIEGIEAAQSGDAEKVAAARAAVEARVAQHDADWQKALDQARALG